MSKPDHPLAVALWNSDRPARLEILCPKKRCRLALVFDIEDLGGLVVCQPRVEMLASHFFADAAEQDARDSVTFAADLVPLAELTWTDFGRCRCGVWGYDRDLIERRLSHPFGFTDKGVPYTPSHWTTGPRTRPRHERK